MNVNEQIVLGRICDEIIDLAKKCEKVEDIEKEIKNKSKEFSKKLFSLKPQLVELEIKNKKDDLYSLLKLKNISIDSFTKTYLEKASLKSVEFAILFISSGKYEKVLFSPGYIKDILVGNITEMNQIINNKIT